MGVKTTRQPLLISHQFLSTGYGTVELIESWLMAAKNSLSEKSCVITY